jgi:hypothetical protein
MTWPTTATARRGPLWPLLRRLVSAALLVSLMSATAQAEERPADCAAELASLDRAFVEAMAKILAAGALGEQCAALGNQMDLIARERAVHVRCLPAGDQLDGVLAMLNSSAGDFRQAQMQLGCNTNA